MIKVIQKIIAKIINSKLILGNPYLGIQLIKLRLAEFRINLFTDQVVLGEKAKFYEQAEVINLQNNKNSIVIGMNSHIRGTLLVFAHAGKIEIGENSFVGFGSQIWSANNIKIGSNVLISHNCNIIDTNTHEENFEERKKSFLDLIVNGHPTQNVNVKSKPIVIEDNVWINFNVTILKGVTIGKGAIIAAGSVITKDVRPFTLVAGNPAKIIKELNDQK
jgi:acetyltransferase-like isoleucine patch superfamily enzyme